jgi:putative Mn2+ efflux pump MntP
MAIPLNLWLLALALSMDACAAALALGAGAAGRSTARLSALTGLVFGGFQGAMPLAGAAVILLAGDWLAAFDHWVAFLILVALGLQMVRTAWLGSPEPDRDRGLAHLVALGLATSLDAAAAGVALPLFPVPILLGALAIGATTAILSAAAVGVGALVGARLGRWAEAMGGVVLIGMGVRILLDHLSAPQ